METIVVSVAVGLAGLWVGARLFNKAVGKASEGGCPLTCGRCGCSGRGPHEPGAGCGDPKAGGSLDFDDRTPDGSSGKVDGN